MLAILYTEGRMKHHEIRGECVSGSWAPILCYKQNKSRVVPVFYDEKVAVSFVRRNLPKDWVKGAILLTDKDLDFIRKKGCILRKMEYPNKLTDIKDIVFDLEIIEFEQEPDFITKRA